MVWLPFSSFLALVLLSSSSAELCHDLDTDGCKILATKPDFCGTSPLADSYCKRTCGKCALTCYHCPQQPVLNYHDCNTTLECPHGQTCVIRSLLATDGHSEHIMRCEEEKYCNGFGFGFSGAVVGRRSVNLHCCHTDLCNRPDFTTTTASTLTTTPLPPIQSCHADIVFVVDESGSIGFHGYTQIMTFLTNVVSRLDIGVHSDQVSLVLYDNGPHLEWYLNDYTTKASLLNAMGYVPYHNGTSFTNLALKFVKDDVLQFTHGDRLNAHNVVVVVTDGRSTDKLKTVNESMALRNDGNTVLVIGVGHADQRELVNIATPHYAIQILDLNDTAKALERVLQLICNIV